MPIVKKFFNDGHGILEIVSGTVTMEELLSSDYEVYGENKGTSPPWFFLSDYSAIDLTTMTIIDLKKHVQEVKKMSKAGDVVIALVAPDDLVFGFSRMWQAFTRESHIDMMSFKTRALAEEWLISRVKERFDIDLVLPE